MDFAEKMEELLDNMKSLFDGLGVEGHPEVPLENVPDISGNIPSLIGWRKEAVLTETTTKPDKPEPSESNREIEEEEAPPELKYKSPPQRQVAEAVTTRKEIQVDDIVEQVIELQGKHDEPSRPETPH